MSTTQDAQLSPERINCGHSECEGHPHVTSNLGIFGGRPIVGGIRVAVGDVLVYLWQGRTIPEIEQIYGLTAEQINDAIAFAHDVFLVWEDERRAEGWRPRASSPSAVEDGEAALPLGVLDPIGDIVERIWQFTAGSRDGWSRLELRGLIEQLMSHATTPSRPAPDAIRQAWDEAIAVVKGQAFRWRHTNQIVAALEIVRDAAVADPAPQESSAAEPWRVERAKHMDSSVAPDKGEVARLKESLAHVLVCSGMPSDCDDCKEAESHVRKS